MSYLLCKYDIVTGETVLCADNQLPDGIDNSTLRYNGINWIYSNSLFLIDNSGMQYVSIIGNNAYGLGISSNNAGLS